MSGEPGPVEKLSPVLWRRQYPNGMEIYLHWCPGCKSGHVYHVGNSSGPTWSFNGNFEQPSFTPSMRRFTPAHDGEPEQTDCHYFVTAGKILYCSDSRHSLSGQTVDLPPIPEDYGF